mgnify:FL=1|tara:strand:- start:1243 stop:1734 length:492 start_codon:yes stop_codon:yes gene_type:complete
MSTVKSIIAEAIEYSGRPVTYVTINNTELEDGIVVGYGDYDQDYDLITIYFAVSGNQDVDFSGDFFDLIHEIEKTYLHENVHREQWYADIDTTFVPNLSRAEYMLSPTELEARARVDIPMDLEWYGKSEDYEEYMKFFNSGVKGSYDAITYIESILAHEEDNK